MADDVQYWRVVSKTCVNVRAAMSAKAKRLATKPSGAVLRGQQEGDWVAVVGERWKSCYVSTDSNRKMLAAAET